MSKKQLRLELKERLDQIGKQAKALKSEEACHKVISLSQFEQASTIMLFLTFDNEVETKEIILHAWQQGKTVAVPKVFWEDSHMIPIEINSLEMNIAADFLGVPNPVKGNPVPFDQIDLVITPGLGFDRCGNRLGRGAAYYDRFFSHKQVKALKCGLAFSEQIIESIPMTENDVAVDIVVTDKEVIICDTYKEN